MRLRLLRYVLWGLVALLAAGGGLLLWAQSRPAPLPPPVATSGVDPGTPLGGAAAPSWTLTDQFGQRRSLRDFRGRAVLLSFIDARGTQYDPLTAKTLADVLQLLGSHAQQVQLLAVNANPRATAVADVRSWSRQHGMSHRWLFFTGSAAQLRTVWKHYGVSTQILRGQIHHTAATFLIGPKGHQQMLFITSANPANIPQQAHVIARQAADALHLSISLPPASSLASQSSGLTAGQRGSFTVRALLPGGGTGTLSAGDGSTKLVAFFSTWCQDCRRDLQVLKQYSKARSATKLPPVAAVDLRVAEPSTAWVRQFVAANKLPFAVGLDSSGKVSDAYGVTALPLLAVVSPDGRIVWRHIGVLSLGALQQAVQQASRP